MSEEPSKRQNLRFLSAYKSRHLGHCFISSTYFHCNLFLKRAKPIAAGSEIFMKFWKRGFIDCPRKRDGTPRTLWCLSVRTEYKRVEFGERMDESRTISLPNLRPMIFGLSIFSLVWMGPETEERLSRIAASEWVILHGPLFWPYEEVLLALLLLVAALGLLLDRLWSQCASLNVSGLVLYSLTIRSFWKLAHNAEVPLFSDRHLSLWYPNMYHGQLLHIALSALIFCCAAASVVSWSRRILN